MLLLPFTTQQNVSHIQIQSICRGQIKGDQNDKICLGKDRKHCGKRRKCWLPAFSPFLSVFSKGFFIKVVKTWDCVVEC